MSSRIIDGHRVRTDARTSERMAGVRQSGTGAELRVRAAALEAGLRYRLSNRDLPGSPDLANRARRWAVFVHGCFWHRHRGCPRTTSPKRNASFWNAKFEANVARDRRVMRRLREMGFAVVVIWECEDPAQTRHKVEVLANRIVAQGPTRSEGGTRCRG